MSPKEAGIILLARKGLRPMQIAFETGFLRQTCAAVISKGRRRGWFDGEWPPEPITATKPRNDAPTWTRAQWNLLQDMWRDGARIQDMAEAVGIERPKVLADYIHKRRDHFPRRRPWGVTHREPSLPVIVEGVQL